MKFYVIRSIAALFFLFSGSAALAQSENDWKACIQATQSSADAIYAADWNSVITLSKKRLQVCSWGNDPETVSSSISSIGLAYFRLGDFINSKVEYYFNVIGYVFPKIVTVAFASQEPAP